MDGVVRLGVTEGDGRGDFCLTSGHMAAVLLSMGDGHWWGGNGHGREGVCFLEDRTNHILITGKHVCD